MVKKAKRGRPARQQEIEVKVGRTGGIVHTLALEPGATVEEALQAAGVDYDAKSRIKANGTEVNLEDVVEDGDRVLVSGTIKGGLGSNKA